MSVARVVLWIVLVAVGCRAYARPVGERDTGAKRGQPKPRAISEVVQYCADRVGFVVSEQDIHQDDAVAREQATFLDRDLKVPALRRRTAFAFANFIQTVDGERVHVGIVEYTFRRCQDLDAAADALAKIGRSNFNVAALSIFRSFRRENTLLILFSETPFHPKVRALLDSAAQQAPGSLGCEGR